MDDKQQVSSYFQWNYDSRRRYYCELDYYLTPHILMGCPVCQKGDGTGGESIYGDGPKGDGSFADDNFVLRVLPPLYKHWESS